MSGEIWRPVTLSPYKEPYKTLEKLTVKNQRRKKKNVKLKLHKWPAEKKKLTEKGMFYNIRQREKVIKKPIVNINT